MKLICNKANLYEAINNVSKAVAVKSTIQALEGIKLKLINSVLFLTGYDLEIGIKTQIMVKSDDSGELIINSRLFSDIVKRMPGEDILITVDENLTVTVSSGVTEYKIPALPADEFPEMPEVDEETTITISQSILKNMINQTIYAVATNENKPILTGELFDINEGIFNLVAIDGFRLAVRTEKLTTNDNYSFVVPSKALSEVSKLLKDEDELTCTINTSRKHIIFDISGYLVISRLLEGDFHNYKGSIPPNHSTEVVVNTKELINSLERCSLLINERIKAPVKCYFENDSLKISCSTAIGKINDEIPVNLTGPKVEIGFNNKFFLDALKASDCDKVKLQMNGGLTPMKVLPLEGESFKFLVLPMRLKSDN